MKKLLFILSLVAFIGSFSVTSYAQTEENSAKQEVKKCDHSKVAKKSCCVKSKKLGCSKKEKKACDKKDAKKSKSCCSKDKKIKKSCCSKDTKTEKKS